MKGIYKMIVGILIVLVVIFVLVFITIPRIRLQNYYSDLAMEFAFFYLVLKDMDYFKDSSKDKLTYATSVIFLKDLIKSNSITLKDVWRQVLHGRMGKTPLSFAWPSQGTTHSFSNILFGEVSERERLACVLKNLQLLKQSTETPYELTSSDVNIVMHYEKRMAEAMKTLFNWYDTGRLQNNVAYQTTKRNLEHLVLNTEVRIWINEYELLEKHPG